MSRAHVAVKSGDKYLVAFQCPGCDHSHMIDTNIWTWNEDVDFPTFSPSVLVKGTQWAEDECFYKPKHSSVPVGEETVCHSFVSEGKIQFLDDCTHEFAGQTVDLPDWRD